jgi:hypothetical protein
MQKCKVGPEEMNTQDRVKELSTRQIYYGSSMTVKLNAVKGKFYYKVYAWLNQGKQDKQVLVKQGKYLGQDPEELFNIALAELDVKGIKIGVPQK